MDLIEKFIEQAQAFEAAYKHGTWNALRPYFADDVTYEVMNMPFHCEVTTIDRFIAGLIRATDGFDKKCHREIKLGKQKVSQEGNNVLVHTVLRFTRNGSPPIEAGMWEIATYDKGVITRMMDIYDPGASTKFKEWMRDWGEGLDPRYDVPDRDRRP